MRRGFKAEAERRATAERHRMGLSDHDVISEESLAEMVGAELRDASRLVGRKALESLDALQPGAFSACTFEIGDRRVIVWSPLSSFERRRSDIAHEVSHLLLGHKVQDVQVVGGLTFYSCNPEEEQEANWLAGCLLLPRPMLVRNIARGMSPDQIAVQQSVSLQMANFRVRATGVLRQIRR